MYAIPKLLVYYKDLKTKILKTTLTVQNQP